LEGPVGRFLLQREDQAADGWCVIVGGEFCARWTGRAALGGTSGRGSWAGTRIVRGGLITSAGLQRTKSRQGKGRRGRCTRRQARERGHCDCRLGPLARAARRALAGLALRLAVVSHSPFHFGADERRTP